MQDHFAARARKRNWHISLFFIVVAFATGCSGPSDDPESVNRYMVKVTELESHFALSSTSMTSALRAAPGTDSWRDGLNSAGDRFKMLSGEISDLSGVPPSCKANYETFKQVGVETVKIAQLLHIAANQGSAADAREAKAHVKTAEKLIRGMPIPAEPQNK